MALEVNAQYLQFVQFAQQQPDAEHSKAIARTGAAGPLDGHAIKAAEKREGDAVRPFLPRSRANKNKNDAVRDLFRQSIRDLFGGEDRIPPNVKEAMRLQDYGDGRPLTARRIMTVKAAVDEVLGRVDPAIEQAKAKVAGLYNRPNGNVPAEERRNTIDNLVDTLVRETAADKDALDVAVSGALNFVKSGNAALRSPEEVREKAGRLLADIAELRTLAGGNKAVFDAGKAYLIAMGGKTLPEGFLRDMVNATAQLKMDKVKSLSASSSGESVHKAVRQFADNLDRAMVASGALRKFKGADEIMAAQNLAAGLLLARCGEGTARKIAAATTGATTGVLYSFYGHVSTGRINRPDAPDGLKAHTRLQGTRMGSTLEVLNLVSQMRLGTAPSAVRPLQDPHNPDYNEDIDGNEILENLEEQARNASAKEQAGFARNAVAGEGPVADKIRGVYARFGGEVPQNSAFKLQTMRDTTALNMINLHLCDECKLLASRNHADSQFAVDRNRGTFVRMPNGTHLSTDLETARDELAAFVTNGAKTTYASLDAGEKGKVHVLMGLLNQKTAMAATNAEPLALDPNGHDTQLMVVAPPRWEFSISFARDGSLKVDCTVVYEPPQSIDVANGKGRFDTVEDLGGGSKVESSFALEIKPQEFDRLAALDFSRYDDGPSTQHIGDPNVKQPYLTLGPTLGEGFRFGTDNSEVTCKNSFKITIA